jgi:hypothetical protein
MPLENQYAIYNQIYEEHSAYRFDSAMYYTEKNTEIARRLNIRKYMDECKIHRSMLLSTTGMYRESIANIFEIERNGLDSTLLFQYYRTAEWVFGFAKEFAEGDYAANYERQEFAYLDSVCLTVSPDDVYYYYQTGKKQMRNGNTQEAKALLLEGFDRMQVNTRLYAMTAFDLARIYKTEKNEALYLKYLILSAISDQVCPLKENLASQELSIYLYNRGEKHDLDRAYTYIQCAMDDARFYNNRLRMFQLAGKLPLIVNAYRQRSEIENRNLKTSVALTGILSLLMIFAIIYIGRQMILLRRSRQALKIINGRLNESNGKLTEANTTREQYVGVFLDLCSSYIDKLNEFRKTVKRKIEARKTEELYAACKSDEFIANELNGFLKNFDSAFLHLFPSFVDDFNALLKDGEQISLKKGEILTKELRIFALIRLGITDSARIALFLRYSLQTVYNYRTKIRNCAKGDRNTFEQRVMEIRD